MLRPTAPLNLLAVATISVAVTLVACVQDPVASVAQTAPRTEDGIPNCTNPNGWPTSSAFTYLKNAGITSNERLDFSKTKTTRLAAERLSGGLFRQIHHIIFTERSGRSIEVITMHDASNDECSMSGVDVHVISRHFGPN